MWIFCTHWVVHFYFHHWPASKTWRLSTERWEWLNLLGVCPEMYTYPFFQARCAVYVKLPFHPLQLENPVYHQHGHFYVGSTSISVCKRDFNRSAKLKQLGLGQAVNAELFLRYWQFHQNFSLYILLVLETQAWHILYLLSLYTRRSYETCQRIWSGEFHTLEVYDSVCIVQIIFAHGRAWPIPCSGTPFKSVAV